MGAGVATICLAMILATSLASWTDATVCLANASRCQRHCKTILPTSSKHYWLIAAFWTPCLVICQAMPLAKAACPIWKQKFNSLRIYPPHELNLEPALAQSVSLVQCWELTMAHRYIVKRVF